MKNPENVATTFLGSFLLTTFLLQWWQEAGYPRWLWILLGITFLNILPFQRLRTLAISCVLGITIALLSVARTTHIPVPTSIDSFATGERITVQGIISDESDRRPMQTKYTVEVSKLMNESGASLPVTGKILATDRDQWPEFEYGDEVEVTGRLERPGKIETFHYDRYLSRYGIYSVLYFAKLKRVSTGHGNPFFALLFNTKQKFEYQINRLYAEPHASFLAGLLTGSRKGIPNHLLKDFQETGLTHIIAISGYNITIIISIIAGMLFWLPLKWRFLPAVGAITAFTLFVGASAAVVRASIMGILGLLALQTGRIAHTRLAILWTLFMMLLWNPKYLWYDAGFQLSFLAVLGLTELAPHLDRWFKHIPTTFGIREALQMTVTAQLTAIPFIVVLFGQLSLIAPIANVLVAPAIPPAMLFGFLGTALSFIWFPLGQLFAFIGWAFLQWITVVATLLAHVPFASVGTPIFGTTFVLMYYTCMAFLLVMMKKKKKKRR